MRADSRVRRRKLPAMVAIVLALSGCGGGGSGSSTPSNQGPAVTPTPAPTPTPTPTPTPPPISLNPVQGTPNILLIVVDDLRPELGAYGNRVIQTPNIDRLAASGAVFEQSFVSQAICAPSRAAMMLGKRPDTTKIYFNDQPIDQFAVGSSSMPDLFRQAQYETVTIGKVYHHHSDDKDGFSRRLPTASPEYGIANQFKLSTRRWPVRAEMEDARNVATAVTEISKLTKDGKPFFFAVGINKPHMPFTAPMEDWSRYDPAQIPSPINPSGQIGNLSYSFESRTEVFNYDDLKPYPPPSLPAEQTRELRWGYYASVSYVDSLVGELMAALEREGIAEDTIVVLWSDHGWKLGDHGYWSKGSNADIDIRTPLIVSAPGRITPNLRINALVEAVDIMPTLLEMAGLAVTDSLEGQSFVPLFRNPGRSWKEAAFTLYPRFASRTDPSRTIWGQTVRTARFRYTAWVDQVGNVVGRELYDHLSDPNESRNVASLSTYSATISNLDRTRVDGWKAVRDKNQ